MIDGAEHSAPPGRDWTEVVWRVADSEGGHITAKRTGDVEKLTLRLSGDYGVLEHWTSDDGLISLARFFNRRAVTDERVEFPCCGCGIPLEVPNDYVLRKADAVRLFLQFLGSGELPTVLAEPPCEFFQQVLPGMEEFVVSAAVLNAVAWDEPQG